MSYELPVTPEGPKRLCETDTALLGQCALSFFDEAGETIEPPVIYFGKRKTPLGK